MNIIEIKDLNFSFENNSILSSINLNIKKGSFVLLTGSNSSGKTTLLKIINGILFSDNTINIDGITINKNNLENIHKVISYISIKNIYLGQTVYDELSLFLNCDEYIKKNRIKKILEEFKMLNKMYSSPSELSYIENQKLAIIKSILKKSKVICLDNIFSLMDSKNKKYIIDKLKYYSKSENITIIYASNDLEDSICFDRIIVLHNKSIILDGNPMSIFEHENILKKIGLKLPLIYELNDKLLLYDLIDNKKYTLEELVDILC